MEMQKPYSFKKQCFAADTLHEIHLSSITGSSKQIFADRKIFGILLLKQKPNIPLLLTRSNHTALHAKKHQCLYSQHTLPMKLFFESIS